MKNGDGRHLNGKHAELPQPMVLPKHEALHLEVQPARPKRRVVHREIVVSLAELDQLRAKVAEARGNKKLQLILDAPVPGALIQRMPPQEFMMTIKDIGKSDCAELVELASPEQIGVCLDLDCWKKDRFDADGLTDWLAYLQAGEITAAERILQSVDVELLVLFARQMYKIYYRVDEDYPEESIGDLMETPDLVYIVEIPFAHDDPRSATAHGLLQLFLQYGFNFYQQLFEYIRWGLDSDLEEIAYQFRLGRLEDQGFIDYFEAISIYQPLRTNAPLPERTPVPPHDELLPILTTPLSGSLLSEAFKRIEEPDLRLRMEQEVLFLTNKVLCADQIDPGHLQAVRQTTRKVHRTLDLGLEWLSGGEDPAAAAQQLRVHPVEWIFRAGFSAAARLRKKARQIAKNDQRFGLSDNMPLSLLNPTWREVLHVTQQTKPSYHTSLDTPPGTVTRPFRKLQDIQRAQALLDTIALLPRLFFDEFGFDYHALYEWTCSAQARSPQHIEDIQFSHLFLTALAQYALKGTFVLKALSPQEIQDFLNKIFQPAETAPHTLDPSFQAQVEAELLRRPGTSAAENIGLQRFLQQTWDTLCEEAAHLPFPLKAPPDTRFINLFLSEG